MATEVDWPLAATFVSPDIPLPSPPTHPHRVLSAVTREQYFEHGPQVVRSNVIYNEH